MHAYDCVARIDSGGRATGSFSFWNNGNSEIVSGDVLIAVPGARNDDNARRMFHFGATIEPNQTRPIVSSQTDGQSYWFKGFLANGCEVEWVTYADGSRWELGSPL